MPLFQCRQSVFARTAISNFSTRNRKRGIVLIDNKRRILQGLSVTKNEVNPMFSTMTRSLPLIKRKAELSNRYSSFANINNIRGGDYDTSTDNTSSINQHNRQVSTSCDVVYGDNLRSKPTRAFIAIGSNTGDRFQNIQKALFLLKQTTPTSGVENNNNTPVISIGKTSFLYETAPMYVLDQPSFLNGVIEIYTSLSPFDLLIRLKEIESLLGRDVSSFLSSSSSPNPSNQEDMEQSEQPIRFGPRPLDLDILFYNDDSDTESGIDRPIRMEEDKLILPHPRIQEREFVLTPFCDIDPNMRHPYLENQPTMKELLKYVLQLQQEEVKDDTEEEEEPIVQVIPLPRKRFLKFKKDEPSLIMGILNVTPDSFSDGGKFNSVDVATEHALEMIHHGVSIIDIGGESTRPGAKEIPVSEQIKRTVPIIRSIRDKDSEVVISIDTRHSQVAKAAIEAGADIVNDVSGGLFDPEMLRTVSCLNVPIILMHMRGTPETMQSMTNYDIEDGEEDQGSSEVPSVVTQVSKSLMERSNAASKAGIPEWLQILDPGIGFAKDLDGNLSLMKHYSTNLRENGNSNTNFPFLLGPSRKGFIGKITNESVAEERDFGTVGACLTSLLLCDVLNNSADNHCNILRVHNVKGVREALQMMRAIRNAK